MVSKVIKIVICDKFVAMAINVFTFLLLSANSTPPPPPPPPPPPVPEGVPPPILLDGVASTVLISWDTPSSPNGVILEYQVEKNEGGDNNFTAIATVAGNAFRVFVDTNILPFTTYEYRIVVVNGAGSTTGPSANFTTPEAGNCLSSVVHGCVMYVCYQI